MSISGDKKDSLINLLNELGQRHGYWEWYYSNGKLMYKGNYVNGEKHGLWEVYFDNGKLSYKGNFVNGLKDGYWEDYFSNGDLIYKGNFVDGNRHGHWESYFYNRNTNYIGYYDMGEKVDYNPDEKVTELTLTEIANKLNIAVNQLRIKE